jgi:hypothetical protein
MDPVWADIDHAWVWRDGGPYYGVPISNFFGWFLTVYIFYQLFALYLRNRAIIPSQTSHWRLAILFYAASAAGNLFVVAPLSLGAVFVDGAGKRLDDSRHSRGISPRFYLSYDASQSDGLGQSLPARHIHLETGSSGDRATLT